MLCANHHISNTSINPCRWWEDFKSRTNVLRFARDRLVEMYFWMLSIVYEPEYLYARILLTKLILFLALLDDVFDNYTSTEDSHIFKTAMERLVDLFH